MEQAIGRAAMFGYAACTPHNIGSIHRDYCMNAINWDRKIRRENSVREIGEDNEFHFGYTELEVPVQHPCQSVWWIVGNVHWE